jgi:hypothetical protein
MRTLFVATFLALVGLASAGCTKRSYDGPTNEGFTGRLTQDGKPITLPEGHGVELKMTLHGKGESFGVKLDTEGKFNVKGWVPIGKYSLMLERPAQGKGGPLKYHVPGTFTIEEGKTEYTIELGKDFKL